MILMSEPDDLERAVEATLFASEKPMTPEQLLRGALHTTPFETATLKRNPDWYTKHKVSPGSCAQCH